MHVETAGKACEDAGEHERGQALPVDGDSRRRRRSGVLARRAQHPAEAAALVAEGDRDRDQRADRRLPDARRLRHRGERVQTGPDLLVIPEQVVRDLEDGERRDAGGEP